MLFSFSGAINKIISIIVKNFLILKKIKKCNKNEKIYISYWYYISMLFKY